MPPSRRCRACGWHCRQPGAGHPLFVFADDILRAMGASDAVLDAGIGYARILFGGNVVIMGLFVINAVFRGAGDAAMAMRSWWWPTRSTSCWTPAHLRHRSVPELGLTGAAVATTIGRGLGVAYQLRHLFGRKRHAVAAPAPALRGGHRPQHREGEHRRHRTVLIASASWLFMVRIVSTFGDPGRGGLAPSPCASSCSACCPAGEWRTRRHAGGPEPGRQRTWSRRAQRLALRALQHGLHGGRGYPVLGLRTWIMDLFTTDPVVAGYGVDALRIICLGYFFYGYGMVLAQAFNGAGDTLTPPG